MSPAWMNDAACKGMDPELMHPQRGDNEAVAAALAVCAECPVRSDCLELALDACEKVGVWGGTTERQRRRIRKDRGVECAMCGVTIPRTGRTSYCVACRPEAHRLARLKAPRVSKAQDMRECPRCGKTMSNRSHGDVFCGWACGSAASRENTRRLLEEDVA